MNLAQLETVVWIARLGSFRAAAFKLNSTQPTVSMRIKELEAQLGTAIFDRTHKKIRITPKGRICIEYAERVLAATTDLRASMGADVGFSGRASIGVVEDIAVLWLPILLKKITSQYPQLSIDFQVDLSPPLMKKLDLGELDVALIGGVLPMTGLGACPLGFLQYAWMCKTGSISTSRPLTPKQLESMPILNWSKQSVAYEVINHWFASNGAKPRKMNFSNSMTTLASLTIAGLGISLLPREIYENEIKHGTLSVIPTSPPFNISPYSAVYQPTIWPAVGKAIAEIAAEVSTFRKAPPGKMLSRKSRM